MPTAEDILAELKAHRRDLKSLFASGETETARKHEEEAKRHDEAAASHRLAATKAREEEDEEDAKRHDEEAKKARMDAAKCRMDAAKRHEEEARKAEDEEEAKRHEEEAKRLRDEEEAAAALHASAEDEAKRHAEEDAAAKKGHTKNVLGMFLRALMDDDDMDAMEDADNLSLLKKKLDAMVYPVGRTMAKKRQEAAHDDEAEDRALIRRMIKQYKDADEMSASKSPTDLTTQRKLRSIEAAMGEMKELLTDVVHAVRDLATDGSQGGRDLATDRNRQQNGGPARRTMSATGGDWRGKFDGREEEDKRPSLKDIDAALEEEGLDATARMMRKLEMQWAGQIKQ